MWTKYVDLSGNYLPTFVSAECEPDWLFELASLENFIVDPFQYIRVEDVYPQHKLKDEYSLFVGANGDNIRINANEAVSIALQLKETHTSPSGLSLYKEIQYGGHRFILNLREARTVIDQVNSDFRTNRLDF